MRFWICLLVACSAPTPTTTGPAVGAPTLWPPIVDSHVHLSLEPVADQLAAHGVEVAVDLASPERALADKLPITVLRAGPMLTHPDGYPLDAWGHDGYGVGCSDAACVTATVDRLANEGARVIKIAGDDDGLAEALMPVAVQAAHAHHLKVAIHALSDAGALAGGRAGCDILAHTPVEPLGAATIAAWRDRAVISTLAAFGGSDSAVENLRALRAAGLTVLYGTDLGNSHDAGPSRDEVSLLRRAGLDDAAITAAMTTTPLAFWGVTPTVQLELAGDPRRDVSVLLAPRGVRAVR
jgi:hypothetical protein